MAERTGLEPATPGVTGRYSNQLNYRSISSGLKVGNQEKVAAFQLLPSPFEMRDTTDLTGPCQQINFRFCYLTIKA